MPTNNPSFADVGRPDDWFFRPVEIIRQYNYISGYADGFRSCSNQFILVLKAFIGDSGSERWRRRSLALKGN